MPVLVLFGLNKQAILLKCLCHLYFSKCFIQYKTDLYLILESQSVLYNLINSEKSIAVRCNDKL